MAFFMIFFFVFIIVAIISAGTKSKKRHRGTDSSSVFPFLGSDADDRDRSDSGFFDWGGGGDSGGGSDGGGGD